MKFSKSSLQIFILLVSAIAIMGTMLILFFKADFATNSNNTHILDSAIALIGITTIVELFSIMWRKNPKKYIYLSYSSADSEIANKIAFTLDEDLTSLSKYRFEILTADSVPYGSNMQEKMQENLTKADVVLVIVSPAYFSSQWCMDEFKRFSNAKKIIIPIVTRSYGDLKDLPKDLSDIKALSLIGCDSEQDFTQKMTSLAKDLIKQRKD